VVVVLGIFLSSALVIAIATFTILGIVLEGTGARITDALVLFAQRNRGWLGGALVVIANIGGIYGMHLLGYTIKEIIGAVVFEIVFTLLINIKKINKFFNKKVFSHLSPRKKE
jgi:hypothetical protein